MTTIDFFGNLSFALIAISFLVKEMLWLRLLSVAASLTGIVFNTFAFPEPVWIVINWNILFCAINAYHIVRILAERANIKFTLLEAEVYAKVFPTLSEVGFHQLIRKAALKEIPPSDHLFKAGGVHDKVMLIVEGQVEISKDGKTIRELPAPTFLGEISSRDTARKSATDAIAKSNAKVFVWKHHDLKKLFAKYPEIQVNFNAALVDDLLLDVAHTEKIIGSMAQ